MDGTDIAFDSADIVIPGNRFDAVVIAHETGRSGYRKMLQTIRLLSCLTAWARRLQPPASSIQRGG